MKFASMEFVAFDSADVIATSGEFDWTGVNMAAHTSILAQFKGEYVTFDYGRFENKYVGFSYVNCRVRDSLNWSTYWNDGSGIKDGKLTKGSVVHFVANDLDDVIAWVNANHLDVPQ